MTVSQTLRPFLMIQSQDAEAAMTFYVSRFPDSEILDIERDDPAGPGGMAR
jgi:predicted 3-demethylubiquinone-9 3-methyltransferase (glyoxalase superfamily)